jgi:hypothetical protein
LQFSLQAASPETFGYAIVYQLLKASVAFSQSCTWTVPYTYKRLTLYSVITFPGKRVCAKETFARHLIFLIFSALLQSFTVKGAPGKPLPSTDHNLPDIIVTKKDMWILFEPRV